MKTYYGEIKYTMDSEHPDIKYVENWTEDKVYTFSDTYRFYDDYIEEDAFSYIKRDLRLVAGGGYNSKHIHNVTFEIKRL